jgi:hypothetical protein
MGKMKGSGYKMQDFFDLESYDDMNWRKIA